MNPSHRVILSALLVFALSAPAFADSPPTGSTLLSDTFSRADAGTGENVTGRAPEAGPMGAKYVTSEVNERTWGRIALDPSHGNPAPSARLASDEKEMVAVTANGEAPPTFLHISGDLCTGTLRPEAPDNALGLGFYGFAESGHGSDGFRGLVLRPDGSLVLMALDGPASDRIPYSGPFDTHAFHRLSYTVDTVTGALYDVRLDGQAKSLPTTMLFRETAAGTPTRYAGFYVTSGTAYVDNFAVSQAAPPDMPGQVYPPIPVRFTLPKPGYVTLVIDDASGKRVRNLVSETKFPAGANVVYWDGLDDMGRDPEAAGHAIYYIPGKMVAAGVYKVRGLRRDAINLRYEMAPYTHGDPPWNNGDPASQWLANHTAPQSALFVPSAGPDKKPTVLVGSYVTEGGSGLAWLDLTGRKYHGEGWIGGNWTGAPFLARDAGAEALPDNLAYAGAAFGGELRLSAVTPAGTSPVLSSAYTFPAAGTGTNTDPAAIGGLAVHNGLLVATLPRLNGGQMLFVDVAARQALGTTPLKDGRGLAFDRQGRLLVLSGTRLLRYTLPSALRAERRLNPLGWKASASVHSEDAGKVLDGDGASRWSTNGPQAPGQWLCVDMGKVRRFSRLVLRADVGRDAPHGYEVSTSPDGKAWGAAVAEGIGTPGVTTINFPPVTARWVKITQTGTAPGAYWSVNTLDLYDAPSGTAAQNSLDHGLPAPAALAAGELEDPQQIVLDADGSIYVSDNGRSQQVKAFTPGGRLVRAIGHAGAPRAGPYDALHMNHPQGITIDSQRHLWVAENDFAPKRVSVWTLDGKLLRAFYGPPAYGGGGEIDPKNPRRWLYGGMVFALDPKTRTARPTDVFSRPAPGNGGDQTLPGNSPQTPLYAHGHMFLTNAYNSSPTNGASIAGLWRMGPDGVARPVAAVGKANDWDFFAGLTPQGTNFSARWSGTVTPRYTEPYTLMTLSDDGVRLWVNGKRVVDNWTGHGPTEDRATVELEAGRRYAIRLEYYNGGGGGVIRLSWQSAHQPHALVSPDRPGFRGEYFSDAQMTRPRLTRLDAAIDTDWTHGLPTAPQKTPYAARLPAGADRDPAIWDNGVFFLWTDANGDGRIEPAEVTFQKTNGGMDGVTVMPDLSFVATNVNGETRRYAPARWTAAGAPVYDAARHETLATGVQHPTTTGGGQTLAAQDGWTIETVAPAPFAPQGLGGVNAGVPVWSYPSLWPGLHASHIAPMPDHPGELIGTTRLIGGTITPKGSDAGELWAVNGNKGTIYVFTTDGLFVATLFHDSRAASWNFPRATPGMLVNEASNQEEDFWPQWTQTPEGDIYLTTGDSYLLRVENLDTVARLPDVSLNVTPELLTQARAYFVASEAARQAAQAANDGPLTIALRASPPAVDGKLDDWADASWVTVDTRSDPQGDWGRSEARVTAALAVAGDRLYAAYRTGDRDLLRNQGTSRPLLFKSGGALDLMLGAVPGGERLLVTQVGGKTAATLYQPRSADGGTTPFEFTSPQRTLRYERVEDVSDQVRLAGDGQGNYEFSVPLALLGLSPAADKSLTGDIGILRGNGFETLQRVYWRNKATGLVSDIPSEAELTPQLWGTIQFRPLP